MKGQKRKFRKDTKGEGVYKIVLLKSHSFFFIGIPGLEFLILFIYLFLMALFMFVWTSDDVSGEKCEPSYFFLCNLHTSEVEGLH